MFTKAGTLHLDNYFYCPFIGEIIKAYNRYLSVDELVGYNIIFEVMDCKSVEFMVSTHNEVHIPSSHRIIEVIYACWGSFFGH